MTLDLIPTLERRTYLVLIICAASVAAFAIPYLLMEYGVMGVESGGGIVMVMSFLLLLPALGFWVVGLVCGLNAMVSGPSRLRIRVAIWYILVVLAIILVGSLPQHEAALLVPIPLGALLFFPYIWLRRRLREEHDELDARA